MTSTRVRIEPGQTKATLKLTELPLELLRPDPSQPRRYFDESAIEDLARSIERQGLIQPITVKRDAKDSSKYVVVAGERRYRAFKQLGRESIPSIITAGNTDEIAIIENLQREDLSPIEEAQALERLRKKHGYTHKELALAVGKGRSTVTNILRIASLPESVKRESLELGTSKSILIEISKLPKAEQLAFWRRHKEEGLTVQATRRVKRGEAKPVAAESALVRAFKKVNAQLELVATKQERLGEEAYEQVLELYAELGQRLERVS